MRNLETINMKGDANVKIEDNSDTSGEKIFDSVKADIIRDESKWDAFQLMGDTNQEEVHHIAEPPKNTVNAIEAEKHREKFVNERIRRLGGKVTAVYNFALR